MTMTRGLLLVLATVGVGLVSCKRVEELDPPKEPPRSSSSSSSEPTPAKLVVENGKLMLKCGFSAEPVGTPGPRVKFADERIGTGAFVTEGSTISVHYACRLESGEVVESTSGGEHVTFTLGKGSVMEGWETGIPGMRVGGKRTLSVPPNRAYGAAGKPPKIPPNARLICDLELLSAVAKR